MAVRARVDAELTRVDYDAAHFWHDDEGAHVSSAEGVTDGGNVLIDADSLDIRDGETVLATFGVAGASLGTNSTSASVDMCGGVARVSFAGNTAQVSAPTGGRNAALMAGPGDPYAPSTATVAATTAGSMSLSTGSYQLGDGSGKPRVVLGGDALVVLPEDRMAPVEASMSQVAAVLSGNCAVYQGTIVVTPSGNSVNLWTKANFVSKFGFEPSASVTILLQNGDWDANKVYPVCASWSAKYGIVRAELSGSTTSVMRINYAVIRHS